MPDPDPDDDWLIDEDAGGGGGDRARIVRGRECLDSLRSLFIIG